MRIYTRTRLIAGLLLPLLAGGLAYASDTEPEDALKAVVVLNFLRYSTWPDSSGPIAVGVVGRSSVLAPFRQVLEGKSVNGRAIHVVEIDWTLPLDADIAGRSEEVQRVLDTAEDVAEDHKVTLEPVLLQARDVGAAIVDETIERGADLLVVGLPYRKRFGGEFAIGRTIPYILQNAPCAVWVVRDPINEESA